MDKEGLELACHCGPNNSQDHESAGCHKTCHMVVPRWQNFWVKGVEKKGEESTQSRFYQADKTSAWGEGASG